ncbi:DUF2017 family protein [Nesterenkonia massiliensis]|uniref:DUF2017 family protein n=1 Tax=Nesterenkonia massiliensis TaxID=1232429 RepID=UPI00040D148F|nr:DUF2017 family protein [Nesterenkonia massiliensis]
MARAFRATTRGYKADLEAHERRLISQLCADVISLLERRGEQITDGAAESAADQGSAAGDDVFAHFRRELAGLGVGLDDSAAAQEAEPAGLSAPEDPVLARLLPEAAEDPQEAAQLRRLTEASLRESKLADLRTARMLLESDPVTLTEEQAPIFGRALNDVRLTLATRLGIEDEADAEQIHQMAGTSQAATTEQFMAEVYAFTTWLQETLFSAMLELLPDDGDEIGSAEEGAE